MASSMFNRFAQMMNSGPDAGAPPDEAAVYRDLYTEMQFSQLELSRHYNTMMKAKEDEIRALKAQVGGGGGGEAADGESPVAASASAAPALTPSKAPLREISQEDFRVVVREWERKMKSNIAVKSEAEAEARLLRETVKMLQSEQAELKRMIPNINTNSAPAPPAAFTTSDRENHAQAVIRMGEEFNRVQLELDMTKAELVRIKQQQEHLPAAASAAAADSSSTVDQLRAQMQELVELNAHAEAELKATAEREAQHASQLSAQLSSKRDELVTAEKRVAELQSASDERAVAVEAAAATAEADFAQQLDALKQEHQLEAQRAQRAQREAEAAVQAALAQATAEAALALQTATARADELAQALARVQQASEEHAAELSSTRNELADAQHQSKLAQAQLEHTRAVLAKESALRRQVHDELMDLKGNIRVFARVRPAQQGDGGELIPLDTSEDEPGVVVVNNTNRFEFDAVFGSSSTQQEVFDTVSPFLVSVMDGVPVTLLAYGQTGSGKTFTMQGSAADPGVNARSLASVFAIAQQRQDQYDYSFQVSVLEIYLEQVLDLLSSGREALDIRIHPETKQNYVPGLTYRQVTCLEDVDEVLSQANKNRTTASHNMNEHSSRSHLVFALDCVGVPKLTVAGTGKRPPKRLEAKLTLIDLAGSERVSKTDATGDQLKEAQAINKSLSALGDVISALGGGTGAHVPFRNSKLTYLLQDQLGGQGKVGFFANCHPTMFNLQETVFTLKFAERCRKTELKTRKQVPPTTPSTTTTTTPSASSSGKRKAQTADD